MAEELCSSIFLLLVLMISFQSSSASTMTIHPEHTNATDQEALLSFKSMISFGDPTGSLASWNESTHFCWWFGVICGGHRHPQRVVSLNLHSLGLAGTISPAITNLTFLRKIDLSDNHIHGSIPQGIGRLLRLQHLNLSINSLEGIIPASLSRCSKLRIISMAINSLQGEIPHDLNSCVDLQVLTLGSNNLTGRIPPSLTSLSSLFFLSLSSNELTGGIPSDLGSLTSLTQLKLFDNQLSGGIPPSIGNLTSLEVIILEKNHLSGEIPSTIGNLISLRGLVLGYNQFSGGIPPSLGKLPRLEVLFLSANKFSGVIPPSLWNISSLSQLVMPYNYNLSRSTLPANIGQALPLLEQIVMVDNQLQGPIPLSLSNASRLQLIDLSENSFSGTIPSNLGRLPNLQWLALYGNRLETVEPDGWSFLTALTNCTLLEKLYFDDNHLSGILPDSTANLSTNLKFVNFGNNFISGKISPRIGNLVSLKKFDFHSNLLVGSIPTSIEMLQNLTYLDLSFNNLSGVIPQTLGNLTQLESLYLNFNELSGNIPTSLGNCQQLNVLRLDANTLSGSMPKEVLSISSLSIGINLASNSLTGSIPAEVGNLKNIGIIDMSKNKLSGEIPSTLGECQVLEQLYLNGNSLRGTIPASLSSLRGIQEMDVSQNSLSGKIPDFLQDFHAYYLNLSFNNFEGEVPRLGLFKNESAVSVTGNNKLCGGIPEMHLPACPSNKKHHSRPLKLIIGITISFLFLIVLLSFLFARCWIKSARRQPHDSISMKGEHVKLSYAELVKATNGFSTENVIGIGSFGTVYKGVLHEDGQKVVAVKVLNLQTPGASKSFIAECEAMRNIRHRNLVKILTTCSSVDFRGNEFKAVVFDFMENGSLDDWLHHKENDQLKLKKLNLVQRLNIAIDVAFALDYLHDQCDTPIVHCDLKPSNVLLDHDMTAHVGDFGISRFLVKSSHVSTSSAGLKGSVGYIAPEYGMANKVSTHGDVYSYGILLLEMFTAKRPTDDEFTGSLSIRKYAEMAFPERVMDVIDSHLLSQEDEETSDDAKNMNGERVIECIASVLRIGISCSKELPTERMDMGEIIGELQKVRDKLSRNEIHEARLSDEGPSTTK